MATRALTRSTGLLPSVFEDFFRPWNDLFEITNSGLFGKVLTMPAVNITENKDDYKVSLAAQGMKRSDFNIDIQGILLTIIWKGREKFLRIPILNGMIRQLFKKDEENEQD